MQRILSSEIRPAGPDDITQVRAIAEAAYRPYVARNGREPAPLHEDYAARIADGQLWVLVEECAPGGPERETVRGLLVLIKAKDRLMLDNVAVEPAAQGRG